jgi:hypothetical protein
MKKIISVTMVAALIAFSCGLIPKKVEKNGVRIEYTKEVTPEDANKLLDYLAKNNEDGSIKDFKLSKEGDGFRIKMVTRAGFTADEKNIELMTDFACEISKDVYGGKMINLDLCDDKFALQKGLRSENCEQFEMFDKEMLLFGELELYYGESITKDQRDEVGNYLVDVFGNDERRTFVIDKVDGRGVLSLVITKKKYYEDPELLDIYRVIACDLTKTLGYDTDVHMCDEYMKKQKVVGPSKCDK